MDYNKKYRIDKWIPTLKEIDFMNGTKSVIQEAIEYINVKRTERIENAIFGEITEMVKDNEIFTTIELNEKAIVEALKKQIPKRPVLDVIFPSGLEWYFCPLCRKNGIVSIHKHCSNCGQALDWSDKQ